MTSTRIWLTELAWLSNTEGEATPERWHERIRPDQKREDAERQFYRLCETMTRVGIPWRPVPLPRESDERGRTAFGARVLVDHNAIDKFRLRRASAARPNERPGRKSVRMAA